MSMQSGFAYIMERMSEPSSWRGVVALLTAFGVAFSPEQTDKIVAAGLAIIGILGAFTKDKE